MRNAQRHLDRPLLNYVRLRVRYEGFSATGLSRREIPGFAAPPRSGCALIQAESITVQEVGQALLPGRRTIRNGYFRNLR